MVLWCAISHFYTVKFSLCHTCMCTCEHVHTHTQSQKNLNSFISINNSIQNVHNWFLDKRSNIKEVKLLVSGYSIYLIWGLIPSITNTGWHTPIIPGLRNSKSFSGTSWIQDHSGIHKNLSKMKKKDKDGKSNVKLIISNSKSVLLHFPVFYTTSRWYFLSLDWFIFYKFTLILLQRILLLRIGLRL